MINWRKEKVSKYETRKHIHKLFEGAGAGVEITVHEFKGKLVGVEDGGKDCDCILHLENCSMLGCTVSTYYWSSPDWMVGDFENGKVDLKVVFPFYEDNEVDDVIKDIEIGQNIAIDDLNIMHGGGWSHVSLDGENEGQSNDTFELFDINGDYVNCEIQSIVFNFGEQIEDFYQDAEDDWLKEEDDNEEFESVRRRKVKSFRESSKYSGKDLISPNMFYARDFKCRSTKVQNDDLVGIKRLTNWKEEKVKQDWLVAGSLPELVKEFMSYVSEQLGESIDSIPLPFVDIREHMFVIRVSKEIRKNKNVSEDERPYRLCEYSCVVSMMDDITEVLDSFANIHGQLESNS